MSVLQFGTGRSVIDPPFKMGLAGYFNTRIWEKVHDSLEVRVALFRQGALTALCVQFELITVTPELFAKVREVAERYWVDPVILSTATHCHTAPELRRGRGGYDEKYAEFAAGMFEKALLQAQASLAPCQRISCGRGFNFELGFNRRFWMRDGRVVTNPPKCSPDAIRPEGEVDPEIPLLLLENENGKLLLASICNHADTTGGNDISGDWPAHCAHLVEKVLGEKSMCMPLIGASGNINHFDLSDPGEQASFEEALRIGSGYAESIIAALADMPDAGEAVMRAVCVPIHIGSRELFPEELAEAHEILAKYPAEDTANSSKALTAQDFALKTPKVLRYFAENLLKVASEKRQFDFEITLIAIGDVLLAGVPCEPFVEIGLELRKEIFGARREVLLAIMNNGSGSGYIPNLWNYQRGGYENTPRSNPYSIHFASELKEACRDLKKVLEVNNEK